MWNCEASDGNVTGIVLTDSRTARIAVGVADKFLCNSINLNSGVQQYSTRILIAERIDTTMRHSRNTWIYSLILLLAAALLALPFAQAASVEPIYVKGNPSCSDLGYSLEFKVDPPDPGTYNAEGFGSVTLASADGIYFDWSASFGVDAVIAKGGRGAHVYYYSPETTADSALRSPDNPNGKPAELSHVSFCYDADPIPTY